MPSASERQITHQSHYATDILEPVDNDWRNSTPDERIEAVWTLTEPSRLE